MPRPKLKPTDEQRLLVKHLSAVGVSQELIARKIGIRFPKTLRKYFPDEIALGAMEANANVAGALYKNATANNSVDAQKFWMLFRGGWGRPATLATPASLPPFVVAREEEPEEEKDREEKEAA